MRREQDAPARPPSGGAPQKVVAPPVASTQPVAATGGTTKVVQPQPAATPGTTWAAQPKPSPTSRPAEAAAPARQPSAASAPPMAFGGQTKSLPPSPAAPPGPKTLRLAFRRSASLDGDRKRLADIVELLSRYTGDDRFEVIVEANGATRWQLDFPNNRTRVCKELQAELTQRMGAGTWKVAG
jgi:hypothetical protein